MKKERLILPLRLLLIAVLIAAMALTFASCGKGNTNEPAKTEPAATEPAKTGETGTKAADDTAASTEAQTAEVEKKEVGEGATTIKVTVKGTDFEIEYTIKTDAEYLADALTENSIVEGEDSDYGLYITSVNGLASDNSHFWSLEQNGEMLMTGASTTPISDGEAFELVYTEIKY